MIIKSAGKAWARRSWVGALASLLVLVTVAGCSTTAGSPSAPSATATQSASTGPAWCTKESASMGGSSVGGYTPKQMRDAYGVTPLCEQGYTGKGQTVVVVDSYGSPTLQNDLNYFSQRFGLPNTQVQILAPLGTTPFDPKSSDMAGWAGETTEDVELIHALAPEAGIVLLTSPVSETEGTQGLPQFMQLEQYAITHNLGTIISQSWDASEYTLTDPAGQALVQQWDQFAKQAATQQHVTFFAGSGDWGATDYADLAGTKFVPAPTSGFPNDDPYVTSVGGTTMHMTSKGYTETAWSESGGGASAFYSLPSFQSGLPAAQLSFLHGRRGLPDVAADADPNTGMMMYDGGRWYETSGTSAGGPTWSAIIAIGQQMAGRPLGYLNPALYQIGESAKGSQDFRDVTSGSNTVTGQDGTVEVQGNSAGPGWDAVTGWGSPIANHLLPDLIAATAP